MASILESLLPLKRFYKFILKRMLGNMLQNELDLNQVDVQLANGIIELRDLELNVKFLNDLTEELPFSIVSGFVGSIKATIPWMAAVQSFPC